MVIAWICVAGLFLSWILRNGAKGNKPRMLWSVSLFVFTFAGIINGAINGG